MLYLERLLNPPSVPREFRSNFTHLYLDIGWYGILSGTSINFLNIYATRLGASGLQIGLLGAMSALVNLVIAIPAGRWIEGRQIGRAVCWSAILYRIGFLLWVPLPWIFGLNHQGEIWSLTAISLLMGIPLTALGVGFAALFADAVPSEWRAYVAGVRNVVLSLTFMGASLLSGFLLDRLPFPSGYQVVFAIGFLGAAMSTVHLFLVRPIETQAGPFPSPFGTAAPGRANGAGGWLGSFRAALRTDVWRSPFRRILLAFIGFHLTQYLAIPLFPLYSVRVLHLTDEHIGIGTAIFYLAMLGGSMQLARVVRRRGHKQVTGLGLLGMGFYPALLGISSQVWHFYAVSAIGGLAWSMIGGAYANYMLEYIPEHDRPAHLAWYTMILNACILVGSLAGPALADGIGLVAALLLIGALRMLAGIAIVRWG